MSAGRKVGSPLGITASVVAVGFVAWALMHWLAPPAATRPAEPTAQGAAASEAKRYKVPVSVSQPARGSEKALVTIVEWCDLTGAACRQSEKLIAGLRKVHGEELRHVWRHFPGEQTEACRDLHELAHTVFEQHGKFWELREALLQFDRSPTAEELDAQLTLLGLDSVALRRGLEKHTHAGYVVADAFFASKFGVTKAPALFVNGQKLEGELTQDNLGKLVEQELRHARSVAAQSVARDKLYEEITEGGLWEAPGSPLAKSEH